MRRDDFFDTDETNVFEANFANGKEFGWWQLAKVRLKTSVFIRFRPWSI
jgi:hypothetical protein